MCVCARVNECVMISVCLPCVNLCVIGGVYLCVVYAFMHCVFMCMGFL